MRRQAIIGVLAGVFCAAPAWAQTAGGPGPTNPFDSAGGNVPAAVVPPATSIGAPGSTGTPIGTPNPGGRPTGPSVAPDLSGPGIGQPSGGIESMIPGASSANRSAATNVAPSTRAVLPDVLQPQPGGMTSDAAARRAILRSPSVLVAEANFRVAQAQQAEAGRQIFPQLGLSVRYTRLSPVDAPMISLFPSTIRIGPIPGLLTMPVDVPVSVPGGGTTNSFPVFFNQFDARASLTIPITDMIFRLAQLHTAAGRVVEARQIEIAGARAQAGFDAREAFYEYARAVGQLAAAQQSVAAAERRRDDLNQFVAAGTVARADLLAAEAQLGDLQRLIIMAHNGVMLRESFLRQRMRMEPGERVAIGENLEAAADLPASVDVVLSEAWTHRPELRSLQIQLAAIDHQETATRASQYPSLAVVGNVDVLNPNTRVFPLRDAFSAIWDVSVNLSWSPNAALVGDASLQRLEAQRAVLRANLAQLRDGFETEIRTTWIVAQNARAQVDASAQALAAAEENLRVQRERVAAGTTTVTALLAAQTDVLRNRIAIVNAHIDLRIALARLRRAGGQAE